MSKLYLVQRRTWYGEYGVYDDPDCIEGGGVPVAMFATRKEAAARVRELEKQARREMSSPFLLLTAEVFDSELGFTDEEFCAAIRALGLKPPKEKKVRYGSCRPWAAWYDEIAETLTPDQRDGIWALFAKVKVYEIVAVPVEE